MAKKKLPQYVWRTITLYEWELDNFLTSKNFQPGKFQILRSTNPFSQQLQVVYVVSESPVELDDELRTAEMAGALKARDVLNREMGIDSRATGSYLIDRYEEIRE